MKNHLPVALTLSVIVLLGASCQPQGTNDTSSSNQQSQKISKNGPPLLIASMPIDLGKYNPATKRAGDLLFPENTLSTEDLPFFDYGYVIQPNSVNPNPRKNPQPTFIAPLGTKVRSIVDGVVVQIPTLYSGDYSIMVAKDKNSDWMYEMEHVINPIVKVGDRVKAGQVVAEVSDYDAHNYDGQGLVEIGILQGGNPPKHHCLFQYLDASIEEQTFDDITQLYADWEAFRGNTAIYDESSLVVPGCLTDELIEG